MAPLAPPFPPPMAIITLHYIMIIINNKNLKFKKEVGIDYVYKT